MTTRKTKRGRPITGVTLSPADRRRLRAGREARGMTRATLADALVVSVATLRAWEEGRRRPSTEALAHWREAVGIAVSVTAR